MDVRQLLEMKVLNLVVQSLMYLNTEVLSVQNMESISSIWSYFLHIELILLAMVTAVNSIQGMVTDFNVTLVFPISNLECSSS